MSQRWFYGSLWHAATPTRKRQRRPNNILGTPPAVTFSPTSLTFPNQVVFTTSPAQHVTLTNSGAGVLKISHIGVTSPFQQTNNCPSSLNPGANCTVTVKFHPTTRPERHCLFADALAQTSTDAGSKTDPISGIEKVGGRVSAPHVVHPPDPEYSAEALDAKYEGFCVLSGIVSSAEFTPFFKASEGTAQSAAHLLYANTRQRP
jgi:hypothetical protein